MIPGRWRKEQQHKGSIAETNGTEAEIRAYSQGLLGGP